MSYIVRHKNPNSGKGWQVDGAGQNWTEQEARLHAINCEYAVHGIPYEIVEEKVPKKTSHSVFGPVDSSGPVLE